MNRNFLTQVKKYVFRDANKKTEWKMLIRAKINQKIRYNR